MFLNFYLQLLHLYTQWTMQGTVFNIYQTEVTTRGVLCEKVVLKNFSKLTRKHLCQSLFFNKVAGLRLFFNHIQKLPGDSWNYMPPILFHPLLKYRNTNFSNCKIKWEKRFILRGFVCDIIRPSKETTSSKLPAKVQE